eukprot:jgi/Hompol1/3079/HPOL_001554-RA
MADGLRQRFVPSALPASGGSVLSSLKKYDAYAKPLDDFRVRTATGALVTIISAIFIVFLTISEFTDWYQREMIPSLEVDKSRKEKMNINVNITFPNMPCYLLSIDVMDVAGEHQNNLPHSMHKTRMDKQGNVIEKKKGELGSGDKGLDQATRAKVADPKYCGSCYGATPPNQNGCCNTCEDVQKAYTLSGWSFADPDSMEQCVREGWSKMVEEQSHESCNVHGHIEVNKVQGNIHFAPGRSFQQNNMHVHDLHDYNVAKVDYNFEHTIHSLSFGETATFVNPLDGVHKKPPVKYFTYQYFVKVVGTHLTYMNGTRTLTNQYSVTEHDQDVSPIYGNTPIGMPGVFFMYEISPMLIRFKEFRKPFTHFLTDLCAIVGGVFTVAGMVDAFLYSAERSLKAKTDLGKTF